ncbi:isoamylase early set domain-containing protein [Agarilytica rhodophyticola]|uniref:isoamylase early set domain-containing protein n=1 Tax=Agarilytica rhodophyticola TaxID=1737490 RepID=UPI000B345384|nr:isoamylase early set domain-containing protein [Agarilytica rhodophyticola]
MSTEKKYLKSKPICKVKFIAPKEITKNAKTIAIAGDFNDWNIEQTILRKQKSGVYARTLDLEVGTEYQYRFVIDGVRWENDWDADKYVPNNHSFDDNSVVVI